jgi:hypothetical protein
MSNGAGGEMDGHLVTNFLSVLLPTFRPPAANYEVIRQPQSWQIFFPVFFT